MPRRVTPCPSGSPMSQLVFLYNVSMDHTMPQWVIPCLNWSRWKVQFLGVGLCLRQTRATLRIDVTDVSLSIRKCKLWHSTRSKFEEINNTWGKENISAAYSIHFAAFTMSICWWIAVCTVRLMIDGHPKRGQSSCVGQNSADRYQLANVHVSCKPSCGQWAYIDALEASD